MVQLSPRSDSCVAESFPRTPIPALVGQAGMTGGYACPGDLNKIARVVAWLNQSEEEHSSEDDAEKAAPADDGIKMDSDVQLSEADCDSSLPCSPSAPSD